MTIKTLAVSDLSNDPANMRTHPEANILAIMASLRRWGQQKPIVIDAANVVRCGNGTLEAARRLGWDSIDCIVSDLSGAELQAFAIADNRTAELAEWSAELSTVLEALAVDLPDLDMGEMSFDNIDLPEVAPLEDGTADAEPQIDKADALRQQWGTALGQLWALGTHRLGCGDGITAAMAEECNTLVFDPEWDSMPSIAKMPSTLAFCDGARAGDVIRLYGVPAWVFAWDCVTSWHTPNRPLRRMKLCLWYGDVSAYNEDGAHYGDSGETRQVSNTRGTYEFRPDPRGKHLSDIFQQPITQLHADAMHSHSKPTDWIRLLVGNCTTGTVFDPFAGSGTTIIACEHLGRKCVAMEIHPGYVAVILQRYVDATGKQPERIA